MRNVWLVIKNEVRYTLGKRSFWIMAFVFPAFIFLLNIGTQVLTNRTLRDAGISSPDGLTAAPAPGARPIGYVDQAGLIQKIPPSLPGGTLVGFAGEAEAQAALKAGQIERYALIPADYLQTGELIAVERDFRPLANTPGALFQSLIAYNLTGDETLTAALAEPLPHVQPQALAPQAGTVTKNDAQSLVPFATLFIFFFLLTMSSGLMLRSVAREKENLTAEVLLLSLRPRELMLGKVLGLSLVALLQMAVWVGGVLLLLGQGQALLNLASGVKLPAGLVGWSVLYFLLGYLMSASMMGAIGALAPNARSGGQFTFLVLAPLMIPFFANVAFTEAPNGGIATFLSLFPLTAPTAMLTRLATVAVPVWQVAVSLCGLVVTTYFIVLVSARFFRPDTLLSPSALTWGRLGREVRVAIGGSK